MWKTARTRNLVWGAPMALALVLSGCSATQAASTKTVATEPAVTRPWPTGCLHGHVSVTVQRVESFLCVEVGTQVTITFEKPRKAGSWVPLESSITAGSAMASWAWYTVGPLLIDHATAVATGYSAAFSSYYDHGSSGLCSPSCIDSSVRIRVSFNVVPATYHAAAFHPPSSQG
jgi:hypothetical protein